MIRVSPLPSPPRKLGSRAAISSLPLDSSPDLIRGSRGNDDSTGRDRALVGFARQVEVRKDAVDVWRHDRSRRANVRFVEFVIPGDTEQ